MEGPARVLNGAAPLESASATDLSYVASERAAAAAAKSAAGCLIVPVRYQRREDQTVIRAASPKAFFARALTLLFPARNISPGIHPSSQIAPDAIVDPSAEIGPFCAIEAGSRIGGGTRLVSGVHIGRNVRVGGECVLHAGVVVYEGVTLGDRVVLHAGCVIGADGFGYAPESGSWLKFPQVGSVRIEDDVEIGANSCVDRAALGVTRIGAGTKIDNLVHVGHNCDIGRNVVIAAQSGFSGGVAVGDGAVIGGQVGVGDKARIESGAVLGSGSGVLTGKVVHAGEPLWGTPARPLREYLRQLAWFKQLPRWAEEQKRLRKELDSLKRDDEK